MILDCEHAMSERCFAMWKLYSTPACRTRARASTRWSRDTERRVAEAACARTLAVRDLVQLTTRRAGEHVLRMPHVFGDQIAGEEIHEGSTAGATSLLHPQPVLHIG